MSGPQSGRENVLETLLVKDLWKVLAVGVTALVGFLGAGFGAGMKYQETQSNLKLVEAVTASGLMKIQMEKAIEDAKSLARVNEILEQKNGQLSNAIDSRDISIEKLSTQIKSSDNCAFIHAQIESLQREIGSVGQGGSVLVNDADWEKKAQARREVLEQRLARFQIQLGTGSCR